MHILLGDEAGSPEKKHQSIATFLGEQGDITQIESLLQQLPISREMKFTRVRNNDRYLQETKALLDAFFELWHQTGCTLLCMLGASSEVLYHEMYEEIFLLSQSLCNDEILFTPDQNNLLQRWSQAKQCKEFGIVGIEEQDSKSQLIIQVMDICAGLSLFLREHYGTYEIRRHSENRYEQLESFERDLHLRCELVDHFFALIQKWFGEVTMYENGLWSVESEHILLLDF